MNCNLLRFALFANATFSGTCGFLLVWHPEQITPMIGELSQELLSILGVGLLLFAAELTYQSTCPRIKGWRALLASIADFLWVIGSIIILILSPQALTETGHRLIGAIALVVLTFGLTQIWGLHRLYAMASPGFYRYCILVFSPITATKMWEIIWQLGDIKRYSPMLKESRLDGDENAGEGVVRHCEDQRGKKWSEEVINVDYGRSFTLKFKADTPDFPFPFAKLIGGWQVLPTKGGSEVKIWWECKPKSRWLGPIIMPLIAMSMDQDLIRTVKLMAADARGSHPSAIKGIHILPKVC